MKKFWFKRKMFGWGWYPSSIEGWLTTLAYIIFVLIFARTIDDTSPPQEVVFTFLLPIAFLTFLFIRIAYRTGEKPRWQWGRRKED